jgi:hypothetical protein
LNLEQALAASRARLAYRLLEDRRVIVDQRGERLILQIQRRFKGLPRAANKPYHLFLPINSEQCV